MSRSNRSSDSDWAHELEGDTPPAGIAPQARLNGPAHPRDAASQPSHAPAHRRKTQDVPVKKAERLRGALLHSALGRLWADLHDSGHKTRYQLLLGWTGISAVGLIGVVLLHLIYTGAAVKSLPGMSPAEAAAVARNIFLFALVLVALLSGATYYLLYKGVIRPIEDYKDHVQRRLAEAGNQNKDELAKLSYGQQKRTEQLDLAMTDNELLRQEKREVERSRAVIERLFKASFETVTDRVIVVNREGRITDLTPMTIDLIGLHRTRVIGEEFDRTVRLFDPFRENPLEYPIRDMAKQVLESPSAIPKMAHVLVVSTHNAQERILLSALAITDDAGQTIGATFRFEADTSLEGHKGTGPAVRAVKTDRATGLPGREMLNSRLRELIDLARERQTGNVLMLVGVDNLHAVADSHGQRAAEELLWNVAQIVQAESGSGNQPYRATADFFAIPFALNNSAAVQEIGKRICSAIAARTFAWRDSRYEATISCGVVDIDGECEDADTLMDLANGAISQARSQGGNRVVAYDSEHPEIIRRRSDKQWVDWILPRLVNGSTHLISQSIVPLQPADGRLPMFELFLRVEDDDGVWITPGAFMQAVERFGYSAKLDLWVLQAVLDEFSKRSELLEKNEAATINLSGASLENADFANDVMQMIALSGVSGRRICFEIDEAYVVSKMSTVTHFTNALRGIGVTFALDRYKASGGFDALRDLPIQYLKIHESLVRRLNAGQQNPVDRMLINSLHEMCHVRGIRTIATGVENNSALEALKDIGVDFGQGILINKFGPVMT